MLKKNTIEKSINDSLANDKIMPINPNIIAN